MHNFPLYPRYFGYYIMRLWFLFDHLFCTGYVLVRVHLKVCSAPCRTLSTHQKVGKSGHCRVWLEAWLHTKPLNHQMRRSGVPIIPASYYLFCFSYTRWGWRLGYTWAPLTQEKRAHGVSGMSTVLPQPTLFYLLDARWAWRLTSSLSLADSRGGVKIKHLLADLHNRNYFS